jgi:hypothetical protein
MSMFDLKTKSPWVLGATFVAIYLVNFFLAWPTTRWGDITTGYLFGDFEALFIWSNECRINAGLPQIFSIYSQIEASDTCSGFNYGTTLLILLSMFPINGEFYVATALTIGVLAVFLLGFFLAKTYNMSFWQKVLVSVAFFSPGTYLLFERGNLDLVIFLLIVTAAVLLGRGAFFPAYFVVVFATLLKFYALPLVVITSLLSHTLRQRILTAVISFLTFAWVIIDFSRGQILSVYGPVQFGYPALDHYFEWLGLSLEPLPSLIGFFAPWFVWALLILMQRRAGEGLQNKLTKSITNLQGDFAFLFTAITFCAMFFVGLSFDYRLIFLALAGVTLILKSSFSRRTEVALWVSLMIALWGSGAIGGNFMFIPEAIKPLLVGGFQLAGDLAVFLWVGVLLYFGALVLSRKVGWINQLLFFVTQHKVGG